MSIWSVLNLIEGGIMCLTALVLSVILIVYLAKHWR